MQNLTSGYINKEDLISEFVLERDSFWTDSSDEREKRTDILNHVIDVIRDFPESSNISAHI